MTVAPPSNTSGSIPSYTIVRMSATAAGPDWWTSNTPASHAHKPRWAIEVDSKVTAKEAVGRAGGTAAIPEDGTGIYEEDYDEGTAETLGVGGGGSGVRPAGPVGDYIHPTNMKIWGLAGSPGGGSSVVLASAYDAQKPDRGGWFHSRSQLYFNTTPRAHYGQHHLQAANPDKGKSKEADGFPSSLAPEPLPPTLQQDMRTTLLSTEARVWEWMYGGGPDVPGATTPLATSTSTSTQQQQQQHGADADAAARARRTVRDAFGPAVAHQTCAICGAGLAVREEGTVCRGDAAHGFDTCGASGLPIQEPGISRACGVCGARSLKIERLVEVLPAMEGPIRRHVGDVCGRCGGKFVD